MSTTIRLRLTSIQTQPAANDREAGPMQPDDKIMLVLTGPISVQWPVSYADAHDGMVEIGDVYEVSLRKVPVLGQRIGEARLSVE